jgi:CDP-glycerol glycerophosphotransferase (TagB/SpsB family)
MKSIFLLLPTGITIRNFLDTSVLKKVLENDDITIICYVSEPNKYSAYLQHERVIFKKFIQRNKYSISNFVHLILRRRFYEIKETETNAILKKAPIFKSFKGSLLSLLKYPFPKSKKIFSFFSKLSTLFTRIKVDIKNDFDFYKPVLVIATHIVSLDEYDYVYWANKKKIRTVGMVKSFDNLTSKGYMPFKYNSVFVWNNIMAEEIVDLYEYHSDQIYITGVPQFDIYKDLPIISRNDFFQKLNLDPKKKTVLFATNSFHISPDDDLNIEMIANHLKSIDAQMIVRIHQMDSFARYQHIEADNVSFQLPGIDEGVTSHDRVASKNFTANLRDTIYFSDVTINTASTMSLDAAALDKPIINISYDFSLKPFNRSVVRFYNFLHYQPILNSKGTSVAHSSSELINLIDLYFDNNSINYEGRKKIRVDMLNNNIGNACNNIASAILTEVEKVN